eukprot:CAMPEP_0184738606 /NCGR_PEP_ID=MMETSP0315-20130426/1264_1 /TAXON_ID=101924 /ORGANISM="Rhodosorus marinus, Strain UTEX LB 2760" /LENGTH=357 /DNA_ID=CAMNT_0027206447 /DNA_START=543 /DNA_END=1616 /DNA_ORIENTATION=+
MDEKGKIDKTGRRFENVMPAKTRKEVYKTMVRTSIMDDIFYLAQRQGRISFYMTCSGEEASVVASAAALKPSDQVFAQYREQGLFLWRGFGLDEVANQCCSTAKDPGKGRQMPVHYGSKELHVHTISSPLGTQLPHAVGAAYHMKLKEEKQVAACYFGEGASSEGDFHAALNFASTLQCPVLFLCRNNGYAISTPTEEQYHGDGVLSRGQGYGIDALRVDGNDAIAVYAAVSDARSKCLSTQSPVLLELVTYRSGHHSTSDDSTRYRDPDELQTAGYQLSAIDRFRAYLYSSKLWTAQEDREFRDNTRAECLDALEGAERERKPSVTDMMSDVYQTVPKHLHEQQYAALRQRGVDDL